MIPLLAILLALLADPIPTIPADAEHLPSGLVTQRLVAGTGTEHPHPGDLLVLRYTLWHPDGKVDSVEAPRKAQITLSRMVPGWREAAQLMVVGERRRAWVPAALSGGKLAGSQDFVIDTELVQLYHAPETPADVAAPPDDATRTASGLAYKVLNPGTGDKHPSRTSRVVVHYSGWTTDGKLFDSSIIRGDTSEFAITDVIKGWTEGLQLMTVGERARFWIPSKLAYGNESGRPHGMLVFDVELVEIK